MVAMRLYSPLRINSRLATGINAAQEAIMIGKAAIGVKPNK